MSRVRFVIVMVVNMSSLMDVIDDIKKSIYIIE